jgi:hypothetical protein
VTEPALVPPGGWLVLCSAADASAVWAYERLRARGRAPVGLLFVEALAGSAVRWEHRVGAGGAATVTLTTAEGLVVRGADLGAVLNRVASPPLAALAAAADEDREYARNELSAFAASWLRALSATVVNAPDPHGLCGRWRRPLEWRALAAQAGFACAPLTLASADPDGVDRADGDAGEPGATLLAVDGRILHPAVPAAAQQACARLTRRCGTRVLGVRFEGPDPAGRGWRVLGATPFPDLSFAGEAGVAALEQALAA